MMGKIRNITILLVCEIIALYAGLTYIIKIVTVQVGGAIASVMFLVYLVGILLIIFVTLFKLIKVDEDKGEGE